MNYCNLQTERLILRNISREDEEFILRHFGDPQISRYLFDQEPLQDLAGARQILDLFLAEPGGPQHRWIICEKTSRQAIGTCGFHLWDRRDASCQIGYDLQPAYQGRGYMREALQEMLAYLREELAMRTVRAVIYPRNGASLALAQRLGFADSGARKTELFQGKAYEHEIYILPL